MRSVLDTLCSEHFYGRGYVERGDERAARFLAREFEQLGLQPVGDKGYLQAFDHSVNTFPGRVQVRVGTTDVSAPRGEMLVDASSPALRGKFTLCTPDQCREGNRKAMALVWDTASAVELRQAAQEQVNALRQRVPVLRVVNKLTWSVAPGPEGKTVIELLPGVAPEPGMRVRTRIDQEQLSRYTSYNVCGILPGTRPNGQVLMVTAHYDHLGMLGRETRFPGANDNASGVATLLDLVRYLRDNPIESDVLFVAVAGEEAGLVGSRFYTENPLVPLNQVRALVNLDLCGSASEGIAIVNGREQEAITGLLGQINEQYELVPRIKIRPQAANSDHYWFAQQGVPAIFIYGMGDITAYHDVHDTAANTPLNNYRGLFLLVAYALRNL